jgi:hypothetical protein
VIGETTLLLLAEGIGRPDGTPVTGATKDELGRVTVTWVVHDVEVLLAPTGPTTVLLDVNGEYVNGGDVPVPTAPTDVALLEIGYGTLVPLTVGAVAFTVTGKL